MLEADGLTPDEVLDRLPFDRARSGRPTQSRPNPKRFRDAKQIYQTTGFLYVGGDDKVHVTELGKTVLRWLAIINDSNRLVIGRHAAYALAACQLRNPSGAGSKYDPSVHVFPFAYIWRAMLQLDDKIDSEELNRALFRVTNEDELGAAIAAIEAAREASDPTLMGEPTITGAKRDDRIIPWMSLASFGWTILTDKRGGEEAGYYEIPPETKTLIKDAATVKHRHREFASTEEYVQYVSASAALPTDVR